MQMSFKREETNEIKQKTVCNGNAKIQSTAIKLILTVPIKPDDRDVFPLVFPPPRHTLCYIVISAEML